MEIYDVGIRKYKENASLAKAIKRHERKMLLSKKQVGNEVSVKGDTSPYATCTCGGKVPLERYQREEAYEGEYEQIPESLHDEWGLAGKCEQCGAKWESLYQTETVTCYNPLSRPIIVIAGETVVL